MFKLSGPILARKSPIVVTRNIAQCSGRERLRVPRVFISTRFFWAALEACRRHGTHSCFSYVRPPLMARRHRFSGIGRHSVALQQMASNSLRDETQETTVVRDRREGCADSRTSDAICQASSSPVTTSTSSCEGSRLRRPTNNQRHAAPKPIETDLRSTPESTSGAPRIWRPAGNCATSETLRLACAAEDTTMKMLLFHTSFSKCLHSKDMQPLGAACSTTSRFSRTALPSFGSVRHVSVVSSQREPSKCRKLRTSFQQQTCRQLRPHQNRMHLPHPWT